MNSIIESIETTKLTHDGFYQLICDKIEKATNLYDYIQIEKLTNIFVNRIDEMCNSGFLDFLQCANYLFKVNYKMDTLYKKINNTIKN